MAKLESDDNAPPASDHALVPSVAPHLASKKLKTSEKTLVTVYAEDVDQVIHQNRQLRSLAKAISVSHTWHLTVTPHFD